MTIELIKFLESSVETATYKKYKIAWKKWMDYNHMLHLNDLFMDEYTKELKVKYVLRFIKYLYDNNMRGNSISGTLTGIKQFFIFNLKPIDCFNNDLIKQGIKSCKLKNTEIIQIATKKKSNEIIPFNVELLEQLRIIYFIDDHWDSVEYLNNKAVYLAVAICLDTAVRISSVTLKDGKDKLDHCIKLNHINIKVKDVSISIKGEDFKQYFQNNQLIISDVELIDLYFFSDKVTTNSGVVLSKDPNVIARTNRNDSQLVDDLINWILKSGVKDGDELLTRYFNGKRKVVTRKQITNGLKYIAELNDIPVNRINTKSLRKGFATSAAMSGMSEEQIKSKGAWSSKVAKLHYTKNYNNVGLLSMDKNNYGLDELKRNL